MAEEKTSSGLFREKSLEAIESPESLNDYLKVTSPGVWLVMAAIITLLVGAIIWGVYGRIETKADLAVVSADGKVVCYVPYDSMQAVMEGGVVTIGKQTYAMQPERDAEVTIISEDMNPYIRMKGNLEVGDVMLAVPLDASLDDGIYAGTVVVESLQSITLLLQ